MTDRSVVPLRYETFMCDPAKPDISTLANLCQVFIAKRQEGK